LSYELVDQRRRQPHGAEQVGIDRGFRIGTISGGQIFDSLDFSIVDEHIERAEPLAHFSPRNCRERTNMELHDKSSGQISALGLYLFC
jgi:hypothetical protein